MLAESRRHKATSILRSLSTLGPISVAMIIATCDTPHRFRSKRQFWTYCGFAVVTRSSSDHYFEKGELRKRRKPALRRGLNRNYNRRLKCSITRESDSKTTIALHHERSTIYE
jgi:transposase